MGDNNIITAKIGDDELSLLITAFELYNISKSYNSIYRNDSDTSICKNLISQYYKLISPNYTNMILNFKRKYISNEILVEKNDTLEERRGLTLVYDYIQNFDVENDYFNIFVVAMKIHCLLYKPLDDKIEEDFASKREEVEKLMEEAKKEKNLSKYKEAVAKSKLLSSNKKFGGKLRDCTAVMKEFNVDVPDPKDSIRMFNEFLNSSKVEEFDKAKNSDNIFEYIEYCVKTIADLIAMQPFADGNKRTFRSLLNLMFKEKNLPPVYIESKERKPYHEALQKAVCNQEYDALINFYCFKICDSIYELDFVPYLKYIYNSNSHGPKKK